MSDDRAFFNLTAMEALAATEFAQSVERLSPGSVRSGKGAGQAHCTWPPEPSSPWQNSSSDPSLYMTAGEIMALAREGVQP